jgi:hypothetical protein
VSVRVVQQTEQGQRRISLGEAAAIAEAPGRYHGVLIGPSPRRAIDLAVVVRDSPP